MEFRRLKLQLTFTPVEAEPRGHYVVEGQCDMSALVFRLYGWLNEGLRSISSARGVGGFRRRLWA
jgi:hypothetical protein